MTGETLTCGNIAIRIDESSRFGIIVAAVEVVQACFGVVDIAAVAEGVILAQRARHGAGGAQELTPRIVSICHHLRACGVHNARYIALRVLQVEVLRAVIVHGQGADSVVGEAHIHVHFNFVVVDVSIALYRCMAQRITKIEILRIHGETDGGITDTTLGNEIENILVVFPDAVTLGIIGIVRNLTCRRHLRQLPSVLPCIRPCAVVGQVADVVAGQRLSIVAGQQILPIAVAVAIGDGIQRRAQRVGGVGVLGLTEDIAAVVVGVDPCLTRRLIVLAGQLIEVIVDVGGGVRAVSDGGDIAADIVGVRIRLAARCPLVDLLPFFLTGTKFSFQKSNTAVNDYLANIYSYPRKRPY